MKNEEAKKIFQSRVIEKIAKAKALGGKASWTTEDHLRALAQVLAEVPAGDNVEAEMLVLLQDCYNISGFQQSLAEVPSLKAAGHFQRESKAKVTKEDVYKDLL